MEGAVKNAILPGAAHGSDERGQATQDQSAMPLTMQIRPKNRICPSRILSISENTRRQAPGATNGISPSKTRTSAKAGQITSANEISTQRDAGAPRMALKNSEDGSSTITSDLPVKLAL
jgi:hypothetical protein